MKHIKDMATDFDVTIEWAINSRKLFLESEINDIEQHCKEMVTSLSGSNSQDRDFIFAAIKKCSEEIYKLQKEIHSLERDNIAKGEITDEMIEQAKEYPISQLIAITNNMAYCVNHVEDHPSMNCKNNYAYCHACGWHGDAIDVKMKIDAVDFINAVKSLQ